MILKELPLLFDVRGKKILYMINQRFRKGRKKKKHKGHNLIVFMDG